MLQCQAEQFPRVGHAHFSQDNQRLSDVHRLRLQAVRLLRLWLEARHYHRYRTRRYRRLGLALLRTGNRAVFQSDLASKVDNFAKLLANRREFPPLAHETRKNLY